MARNKLENEPEHEKTYKIAKTDQPGHPLSDQSKKLGLLPTHWAHSDDSNQTADAQADLSLRLAHMPFVGFVIRWLICYIRTAQSGQYLHCWLRFITKTRLYSFDPLWPPFMLKLEFTGEYILIFLLLLENIYCGSRYNRLAEVVLTCTHNLCFEQKSENYLSSERFHFLVIKFSIYLNRRVFVMYSTMFKCQV